jgi:preprotein translocase subunit SecG
MTTVAAVVFMLTSLSLAYFSSRRPTSSIMPDSVPVTEEAQGVPAQTQEAQGVPAETPIKPEAEATPPAEPEPTSEPLESTAQQSAVPAQASEPGE